MKRLLNYLTMFCLTVFAAVGFMSYAPVPANTTDDGSTLISAFADVNEVVADVTLDNAGLDFKADAESTYTFTYSSILSTGLQGDTPNDRASIKQKYDSYFARNTTALTLPAYLSTLSKAPAETIVMQYMEDTEHSSELILTQYGLQAALSDYKVRPDQWLELHNKLLSRNLDNPDIIDTDKRLLNHRYLYDDTGQLTATFSNLDESDPKYLRSKHFSNFQSLPI